jgi:hypothetical protein
MRDQIVVGFIPMGPVGWERSGGSPAASPTGWNRLTLQRNRPRIARKLPEVAVIRSRQTIE